ncbi:unnamed protein product [Cylicostephanus goldi]|uniref:Uncharacterized protein n=1 Tax=Cylicostephanus goldi TaxID=71465 RepID=A0A3P6T700_CYLGO|nr:unnamed protein product [Cylicostephanus goldi]
MRCLLVLVILVLASVGDAVVQDEEETCSGAKPCAPGVVLPVWQPQDSSLSYTLSLIPMATKIQPKHSILRRLKLTSMQINVL